MKSCIKSKTLWLGLLGSAAFALQAAVGQQLIPLEYQGIALLLATFSLRFVTDEGVAPLCGFDFVSKTLNKVLSLVRPKPPA